MEQNLSLEADSHTVTKIPAFYGTQRFINMFTRAFHWLTSWSRCIQSTPPHPISLTSVLVLLPSYLRLGLPSGLFVSGFPNQDTVHISHFAHSCYMPVHLTPPSFDYPNHIWWSYEAPHYTVVSILLPLPSSRCSQTFSICATLDLTSVLTMTEPEMRGLYNPTTCTKASLSGCKAAGTWSWPLTSL
jgi:hypothetical protein